MSFVEGEVIGCNSLNQGRDGIVEFDKREPYEVFQSIRSVQVE